MQESLFPGAEDYASYGGMCHIMANEAAYASSRVIYYWDKSADTLYMLWVYKKNRQEDLTPNQLRSLSRLVQEYLA